jgi:AbiV family abortive infection protein
MTRRHLQELTRLRLREARLLLKNKNYSGAYYLAGYSIECALKACIARKIRKSDIPDKNFLNDFYKHDLKVLVKLAGLEGLRQKLEKINTDFSINWAIVKDWDTISRYNTYTEIQATELYNSIISRKGGVLPWIRKYW